MIFNSEHDMALEFFKKVRKIDPYRVEQMHLFSDSLYVRVSLCMSGFWEFQKQKEIFEIQFHFTIIY